MNEILYYHVAAKGLVQGKRRCMICGEELPLVFNGFGLPGEPTEFLPPDGAFVEAVTNEGKSWCARWANTVATLAGQSSAGPCTSRLAIIQAKGETEIAPDYLWLKVFTAAVTGISMDSADATAETIVKDAGKIADYALIEMARRFTKPKFDTADCIVKPGDLNPDQASELGYHPADLVTKPTDAEKDELLRTQHAALADLRGSVDTGRTVLEKAGRCIKRLKEHIQLAVQRRSDVAGLIAEACSVMVDIEDLDIDIG